MIRLAKFISATLIAIIQVTMGSSNIAAQDTIKHITLSEATIAILSNSRAVKLAELEQSIARSNYKTTEAIYLPHVGLTYTAIRTNNPLNAFGLKLQQKSITQFDFNPDLLNHPQGITDFATTLKVEQPILNLELVNKRQASGKQIEVYQFKTQRTKEYLTFEVHKAYLELEMAYHAVVVLREALRTAQSVYRDNKNRFEQGLIQKSDLLDAQLNITSTESSLAIAESNIRNASDYLGLLMGKGDGITYTVDSIRQTEILATEIPLNIAASRSDFLAMQKSIEASDLMIKANKMSYLPKVNAFGSYQLNDKRILGFGANAYIAGVQVSWDIFQGNKTRNAIIIQTLERNKLSEELSQQKEQSQLELNKAYRDLSDAQFNVIHQKLAIEQAAESLLIMQNRFQQGLVSTTEVLRSATQLSQQKFSMLKAMFTISLTKAYIQLLTASANK
ncbi:MAG: TolC family protein [Bacteroidota bacterium]